MESSFPDCRKCSDGVLLPLSDYGRDGAPINYKAWVCSNPAAASTSGSTTARSAWAADHRSFDQVDLHEGRALIRAIVFDLDNTLVDFMKMKSEAVTAAIEGMIDAGLKLPREAVRARIDAIYRSRASNTSRCSTPCSRASSATSIPRSSPRGSSPTAGRAARRWCSTRTSR